MGRTGPVGGNIRTIYDLRREDAVREAQQRQSSLIDPDVQQQIQENLDRFEEQRSRTNTLLTDLAKRLDRASNPKQNSLVSVVIRIFQFIKRYIYLSIHSLRIPLISSRFEVNPNPSRKEMIAFRSFLIMLCLVSSYFIVSRAVR